jgi:hypothetical protein
MIRRLLVVFSAIVAVAVTVTVAQPPVADAETQMVAPTRVMDTRSGIGVRPGLLRSGEVVELPVAGLDGNGSTSVLVNLTTVDAWQPGFVTAWPCDTDRPETSIVNFEPGRAIPNMVVLAYTDSVCFSASSPVHLIVDVTAITTDGEISGVAPVRLHDSRDVGRLAAGEERAIAVAGTPGIPGDAAAGAVNVTIVRPSGPGYAIVKPCGTATDASTINFLRGEIVAHFTLAALSEGNVCVFSSVDTDVIVDSFGYTKAGSPLQTMAPSRALDTRQGTGALASGQVARVQIAGAHGVPADAGAATVNVAVIGADDFGFVTAWPCAGEPPLASTVNIWPGAARSNQATIKLSDTGEMCFRPHLARGSSVDLIVDVLGFATGTTSRTLPPPPVIAPALTASSAGDAGTTVGATSYAVPGGAVIASNSGDDSNPGSVDRPVRTLARALSIAPTGGTIVLRGGVYRESVTVNKRLTVQSWPGEAVWLEGADPVTNWAADGDDWRADGWTTEFDASPTYTRGAADNLQEHWGFVNEDYPLAAHPDQVFVDGVALRQVGTRGEVVDGTFFHDLPGNRLYIGSNPVGRQIDVSNRVRAIAVRADGVVLRGFGIRRFAPSVPDMGAVTLERPGATLEHVAIVDTSTTAIHAMGANIALRNLYVARSGMLGVSASNADNLLIDRVLAEQNNVEHFNNSPVSGGIKVGRLQGVTVMGSIIRDNLGPGFWADESTYDIKVIGSELRNNAGHGISLEISAKALIADSIVAGNAGFGIKVNNISDVRIWNNTFVGNGRTINIVQDERRYGDGSPGKDPRFPNDPNMTWLNGPVQVVNNIIANPGSGNCLLCVEDYSRQRTAEQIGVTANGNVYNRTSSSSPSWVVIWSRGASNPAVFTSIDAFRAATGQEASGTLITGGAVVDAAGVPNASLPGASMAVGLPGDIAGLIGQPAGAQHVGAW